MVGQRKMCYCFSKLFFRTPWTTSNVHEHHRSACHFVSKKTQKRSGCHLLQVQLGAPQVSPRQSMCGCTHDFPLEISASTPSPLRLLECQNLVVTLPLSCLQTVKVNTENSEEEEYVPQERQPSEANKNNGCASTRNRFHF